MENKKTITIQMDGVAWCATREGFINLQESNAGFGDTPVEALENMLEGEMENLKH